MQGGKTLVVNLGSELFDSVALRFARVSLVVIIAVLEKSARA